MRRSEECYTIVVGARLNPDLHAKLKALGRQTQRDVADVLRVLIRNAQVGAPDPQSTVVPQPPDASARSLARHGFRGNFSVVFGNGLGQDGTNDEVG